MGQERQRSLTTKAANLITTFRFDFNLLDFKMILSLDNS